MSFCLPKNLTKKIQESLNTKGITAEDISNMTSAERLQFFKDALDSEGTAKNVHQSFEKSKQFQKMMTSVSLEEANKITELATGIEKLKPEAQKELLGTSKELLQKRNELADYLRSLNEKPAFKSIVNSLSSLYKNLFLAVKTGVKTFGLGTINSALEVVTRRVGSAKLIGDVDLSLKLDAAKENIKLYGQTGDNTFLQVTPNDNSAFGMSKKGFSESFGEKDAITGKGVAPTIAKGVNTLARGVKFFAIDILHKAPMSITSSINFVDALDITSSQLAKMDYAKEQGLDANAIFRDSLKIEPETDLGKIARNRSQQDMFRVLNINNTPLSEVTMKLQREMNKQIPTLGNYIIPIAKVPSSIVFNEIENFGVGLGTGLKDVWSGIGELHNLKINGKESSLEGVNATLKIKNGTNTLVRTVGVIATAAIITQNLTKKDFYTDYYGNSYVKMGAYWLNTNVFGGARAAVSGVMHAKLGNDGIIFDYGTAGYDSLGSAPIVDALNSFVQEGKTGKMTSSFVSNYLNPVLLKDIEKSSQEDSLNPLLVGSLIRTEQQKKEEDKISAKKSATNKALKAKSKNKKQTIF